MERAQILPNDLVLTISEHPLRTLAPQGYPTLSIRGQNGIISGKEYLSEMLFRFLQGGKHLIIRIHQLRELELAGHFNDLAEISNRRRLDALNQLFDGLGDGQGEGDPGQTCDNASDEYLDSDGLKRLL
jgi:hypothetical protein